MARDGRDGGLVSGAAPRAFEKWNTWLNGVQVEVMVWDGESGDALRVLAGPYFCRVRPDDRVAVLSTDGKRWSGNLFARPGDFIATATGWDASNVSPVVVIGQDVPWARAALGGPGS